MTPSSHLHASARVRTAAAVAAAVLAIGLTTLGCHSGTPAAPEGTRIDMDFDFVPGTRNPATGDFEAKVFVYVLDDTSNVPQVGVNVYFQVESGPGSFIDSQPVKTNGAGYAEKILQAFGATGETADKQVVVSAFSGVASSETLTLDVNGGSSSENFPPEACFTTSLGSGRRLTATVSCSIDEDCPGGVPDEWTIDWGDGSATETFPFQQSSATHNYAQADTYTVRVTVKDCDDLTDAVSRDIVVPEG